MITNLNIFVEAVDTEDINDGWITDDKGVKRFVVDGLVQSIDGEPAMIYPGGRLEWYDRGKLHRTDGPAIISPQLGKLWFLGGNRIMDSKAYFNGVKHSLTADFFLRHPEFLKYADTEMVQRLGLAHIKDSTDAGIL